MREDFKNLIVTQALRNENSLEVAFETFANWQNILNALAENLYLKLKEPLQKQLKEINGECLTTFKSAFNIHISNPLWNLEFGIGDYDGDRLHFFINSSDDNKIALYAYVKDKLSGTTNIRIWYQRAKQPYNKWDTSIEGLFAVYNSNEFINYAVGMLFEIAQTINDYYNINLIDNA